ncbi:MAG: hypothetical protein PHI89_00850 [Thiovulaceae bacterium]|jgi:GH24 family phage-related lysozyme (muramidase)|nr:hypothetical protein [Sulfurimonadaceae bacterium]MDD3816618.1 hypothetical protein [Sulfurimonadaceae bacterium]
MATIKEIITKIEGNKSAPYYDGVGKITIGIGFNIESVFPRSQRPRWECI